MLDDEAFARTWVESRDRGRRGERAIREELRIKGIDRETIDSCSGSVAIGLARRARTRAAGSRRRGPAAARNAAADPRKNPSARVADRASAASA